MRIQHLLALSILAAFASTASVGSATPPAPPPRAPAPKAPVKAPAAPRARAAPKASPVVVTAQNPKVAPVGVPGDADAQMRGHQMTYRGGAIVPGDPFVVGKIQKHPTRNLWAYSYVNREGMIWRTDFVRVQKGKVTFYNSTGLTEDRGLVNEMMAGPHDGLSTSVLDETFVGHGAWPLAATVP